MKILYVASYDVSDMVGGNGTDHFKMKALEDAGCDVIKHSPIIIRPGLGIRAYEYVRRNVTGSLRRTDRTPHVLKKLDRAIRQHPFYNDAHIIMCPNHFDVSYFSGKKTLVIWTDATYKNLKDAYPTHSSDELGIQKQENKLQTLALRRADIVLWSSHFAMRSAVEDYGAERSRQKIVPFGLNLWSERDDTEVETIILNRQDKIVSLLFVGTDYKRKGWHTALDTVIELNQSGTPARLNMVGGQAPVPSEARRFVKIFGRIDKTKKEDLEKLESLYRGSHFLIMPTMADMSPMPPVEAMSFACPTLINDVGATSELVSHGKTGFVFPLSSTGAEYADCIRHTLSDWDKYCIMCRRTHRNYKQNHVWSALGKRAKAYIQEVL